MSADEKGLAEMLAPDVLDIPDFLRRTGEIMQDPQQTEAPAQPPSALPPEPTAPVTEAQQDTDAPIAPEEEEITLTQLIDVIKKLSKKRDETNEQIRLLKKQAETLLKKL